MTKTNIETFEHIFVNFNHTTTQYFSDLNEIDYHELLPIITKQKQNIPKLKNFEIKLQHRCHDSISYVIYKGINPVLASAFVVVENDKYNAWEWLLSIHKIYNVNEQIYNYTLPTKPSTCPWFGLVILGGINACNNTEALNICKFETRLASAICRYKISAN